MPIEIPVLNFAAVSPMLVLLGAAILVMFVDMMTDDKTILGYISVCGFVGATMPCFVLLSYPPQTFQTMLVSDGYAVVFYLIFIATGLLSTLVAMSYLEARNIEQGEYHALLILSTIGMMLMAAATDMIIIFLGLEIMSIALYILAAFNRHQLGSGEAGLKYFLLGAFASSFFLYGVALVYGATGFTNLNDIGTSLANDMMRNDLLALIGFALLMVGFSFKVAAVPFQWWTPDVYHGAPTSATAFMSVGAKAAGFAALVRVIAVSFTGTFDVNWQLLAALIAVLTMTGGNIAALAQKDIKRMLAYSSIAHAGYLFVGVIAVGSGGEIAQQAISGILFYLMSYTFLNIGAFAIVSILEKHENIGSAIQDYAGLASRQPLLAFTMLLFMFGLTGIPPFIGFWGKWYVFWAAVDAGFWWLAVIGMLNSAISAFYYIGIVVQMYMHTPDEAKTGELPPIIVRGPVLAAVVIAGILTLLFGFWPTPLVMLTQLGLL